MIIGIDFDGTCVTHEYPSIGEDIGAVDTLRELANSGHQLILWTMRSGYTLEQAVKWFESYGIPLYGVQENPTQKNWTDSPKAYCQLYIDDAALGCPLKWDETKSGRPFVDWQAVREMLIGLNILTP